MGYGCEGAAGAAGGFAGVRCGGAEGAGVVAIGSHIAAE